MQIEPSKARILADCIEGMAADAEDKGKDLFGILLSLEDARTITRSLSAATTVESIPLGHCRNCQKWHRDEGWCDEHSHFVDSNGGACHPWESSNWKIYDENYFCADFVSMQSVPKG